MASSTLHSERTRLPWFGLTLLVTALGALALAAVYVSRINPEVRFQNGLWSIKRAAVARLRRVPRPEGVIVATAGSSGMFGIDVLRLQQTHGLPLANLAMGAGLGAGVLIESAVSETQPGDTLLLVLEPFLLTDPQTPPSLGIQFSLACEHREWVTRPTFGQPRVPLASAWLALRPGGRHCVTMLAKLIARREPFRYRLADVDAGGLVQTDTRVTLEGPPLLADHLDPEAVKMLAALRDWGRARKVRIIYTLPWSYCPEAGLPEYRRQHAAYLRDVSRYILVLKEPSFGAHSVVGDFADSVWHLNRETAALRSDELGRALRANSFWTTEELDRLARTGMSP